MIAQILLLFGLISFAFAATDVKKCSGNKTFPLEVRIDGCDVPPCVVRTGQNMEFEIDLVSYKFITRMKTLVRATTFGVTIPYELPDDVSDVCSNLMYGAYCPLYPEEDVTYKFLFFVNNIYPEASAKIEISIVDQDQDFVTCFLCDVKVRKGREVGNITVVSKDTS